MAANDDIGTLDITDELIAERNDFTPGETPDDMTPWMRPIVAWIDLLNLWVGRIACLLTVPLMAIIVYEVVVRNAFAIFSRFGAAEFAQSIGLGPTQWVLDYSAMIAGALFMLGAGYALMRGVHIRADFIYRNWTTERQMTVDCLLYMAFYFPALLFFLWVSIDYTTTAWVRWERAFSGGMTPLAPARTAMPLAAALLLLQGVSEYLNSLYQMSAERRRLFLVSTLPYAVGLALIFLATVYPDALPLGDAWRSVTGVGALISLPPEITGIIMIAVMLFAIFVGFPISFTLIFLGFTFGAWGFGATLTFYLQTFQFNSTMLDGQLIAVPLFVLMGIVMEKAGLM
ncbi:MAG: TRAP transporter small permease subunit, partial [Pseudomonadota bacterium]